MMERIIGIDYGPKRVGVAVSDPLGVFATALETVASTMIIPYLQSFLSGKDISRFVVGYPKNLNNTPAQNAANVDHFVKELKNSFPTIPVSMEDERFTSKMAFRSMINGGLKKMQRRDKSVIDRVSAALILQGYLDAQHK